MIESFVLRMSKHLRENFSSHTAKASDDDLKELILDGLERAEKHGYRAEREVCKYIDLMVCFGPDFDQDPKLAWNRKLDDQALPPDLRMRAVYDAALAALKNEAKNA